MSLNPMFLDSLIEFRRNLHSLPELSRKEFETPKRILDFIGNDGIDEVIANIGGHSFALVFNGDESGKTVMLRADIDALPIAETNSFEYRSKCDGIAHLCGHDGHSAIMAGVAKLLQKNPPKSGRVVLLFQAAEEVGEGAKAVIEDEKFKRLEPDVVLGMHNLPGFPTGSLIYRYGTFAAASQGLIARLYGKTSHAGEPERGINPSLAVSEIIRMLSELPKELQGELSDFTLLTLIHARIGEIAFGTSPGYAEVMATLRTNNTKDMNILSNETVKRIVAISGKHALGTETEWTEVFPATVNDKDIVDMLLKIAEGSGFELVSPPEPFRWSEDFGYFSAEYPSVLFGIGSGVHHAQLHNPDYDFPDEIIEPTIELFERIIRRYTNLQDNGGNYDNNC